MKFINLSLSLLLIIGLSLVACQKNNEIDQQIQDKVPVDLHQIKVSVSEGRLHFQTSDDLSQAIGLLNAANEEDVTRWEQSIGFKSAETMLQEALAQAEQGTNPAELVNATPELLKYEDEMISLRVPGAITRLVNPDKLVYIGTALYKFTEEGEYVSIDGSDAALKIAEQTKTTKEGAYCFFSNTPTAVVERSCGYLINDQVLVNSTNNRRSILSQVLTTIRSVQSNGLWTVENFYEVKGRAQKRNLFGEWSNYNTTHLLNWNFELDIANRQALLTVGGVITLEQMVHSGSKTESNSWITSYVGKFFMVTNVPFAAVSYADPNWRIIRLNQHNHQGMNGAWNSFSCL